MSRAPRTTIEQWLTLRAVVEMGGFMQAAERLNRSQSSVSYAVHRLQERLGVKLLQIKGRKAQLTEVGRAMLADAGPLIDELYQLEERTMARPTGYQARMRLLIDSLFPKRRLFDALAKFQAKYPEVQVEMRENVRQEAPAPEADPHDLAIAFWCTDRPGARRICDVELVAVSSPHHPLQSEAGVVSTSILSRHMGLAIDGRASPASSDAAGREWRLNNLESAVEAVRSGLCFGWLPRHLIERQLANGELVPLRLSGNSVRSVPLSLTYANEDSASAVTHSMAALLLSQPAAPVKVD